LNLQNQPIAQPPNFNLLARPYRWLEYLSFGPFLWRCRTHFLPQLKDCRRAIVLGDGDGRFTARLLRDNPQIHVTAIDGSPAMIQSLIRAAEPHQSRLTTHIADLRRWQPDPSRNYDLIVSHFLLDCLATEEIHDLDLRLTPAAAPNALWLISEFAIPLSRFGRYIAAPLIWLLYRAFHLLTGLEAQSLPNHRAALTAAGWICESAHPQLQGLLLSELWQRQRISAVSESPHSQQPSIH
jgi:hypothetical protein